MIMYLVWLIQLYVVWLVSGMSYSMSLVMDDHIFSLADVCDTAVCCVIGFRYELQQRGILKEEDVGVVPDVYTRNQLLDQEVKYLQRELNKYKDAAM